MEQATSGREHLAWCVERAMEYAHAGDMSGAWASFTSDVKKHPGTRHIAGHELYGMAMVSGLHNDPRSFKDFIEGWAVSS